MTTETLHFESARAAQQIFGGDEKALRNMEQQLGVKTTVRDGMIRLEGEAEAVGRARKVFAVLEGQVKQGQTPRPRDFSHALQVVIQDGTEALESLFSSTVATSTKKTTIYPKTLGQRKYLDAIREHDVTFGIGPAGTGKPPPSRVTW